MVRPIPLSPQQSGGDPLAGAQVVAHNVVMDVAGAVRRRPGIEAHPDFHDDAIDTIIDGLHATQAGRLFAVGPTAVDLGQPYRNIYVVDTASALNLSVSAAGTELRGGKRPTFAETEALLAIAAGRQLQKVVFGPPPVSSRVDGSPPFATHVVANLQRLVCNDIDHPGQVHFSGTAAGSSYTGHEQWQGTGNSDLFTAEARPDTVKAILEGTSELFIFGQSTMQLFAADPVSAYAAAITLEYGCAAPYGIIRHGQSFAWIDHRRRVHVSDGRETQDIGAQIQPILADMSDVSDAYGYHLHHSGVDAFVWVFPAAGRTLVYQVGAGWGQWSSGVGKGRHIANAVTRLGHETLVGSTGGKVGRYSASAATDLGEPIVAFVETGALDRGTGMRKRTVSLRPTVRRGEGAGLGVIYISWRDDEGPWTSPLEVALGPGGDASPVVDFRSLGVYRTRRWRFEFSGDAELILARADEEFEVLGS